jgi:cytochrome c oxidase cbb3-type subunit 3
MADRDELLDHEYDGIQEYDNDLPRWWVHLFMLTAVFGIWYSLYQHTAWSPTDHEYLLDELAKLEELQASAKPVTEPEADLEMRLLALIDDESVLALGNKAWDERCVACHLTQGQGLVGPNLTDKYWIHGPSIVDTIRVIKKGVPEKGMISWEPIMTPEEIEAVTAYIYTLRGTNPPNPKAPEGEPFEG